MTHRPHYASVHWCQQKHSHRGRETLHLPKRWNWTWCHLTSQNEDHSVEGNWVIISLQQCWQLDPVLLCISHFPRRFVFLCLLVQKFYTVCGYSLTIRNICHKQFLSFFLFFFFIQKFLAYCHYNFSLNRPRQTVSVFCFLHQYRFQIGRSHKTENMLSIKENST